MNKIKQTDNQIISSILDQFSSTTELKFKILKSKLLENRREVDAVVNLSYGGSNLEFVIEYKKNLDERSIDAIIYYLKQFPEEIILCAKYINKKIATYLKDKKISFIDLAGNAYINKPPIFIDIQGKQLKEINSEAKTPSLMFEPVGLKIIFIFLCDEKYVNHTYRRISELAGVSLGMVSQVMKSIKMQGFLLEKNKKEYILVDKDRLLEEWVIYYQNKLRPRLLHRKYTTNDPRWRYNINLEDGSYWSGEIAAEEFTNYLLPTTAAIYTFDNPNILAVTNKLKESQDGEIEILKAFWGKDLIKNNSKTVPPVLVYADLLAQKNPRTHEAAQIIFEKELSGYIK